MDVESATRTARGRDARRNHRQLLAQMSDEELMQQFQGGVVRAFDLLVARYQRPLASYLYRFVGDHEASADLLQETFVRVFRNRHAYRRIARFSTWLFTIAGNLARSEYRRRRRYQVYSLHAVNRHDEAYEVQVEDDTFSPDRYAERTLQDRYIQDALDQLPEEFREVVVLRDVQQLAYEEIAAISGLPMGTVKSRIHRGRARLQELLRNVYP